VKEKLEALKKKGEADQKTAGDNIKKIRKEEVDKKDNVVDININKNKKGKDDNKTDLSS